MKNLEVVEKILDKVNKANNILVIASNPIDPDCLGTSLSIKWWLEKLDKKVKIYAFSYIPDSFSEFPKIEEVVQNQLYKVDFSFFDLIVLPDGNSLGQFFTNDFEKHIKDIDKSKLVNIDHHVEGEISKDPEILTLNVKESCTAKVFYDYFLKDSKIKLDAEVSNWMYYALIGDTGRFEWEVNPTTFSFADLLIKNGADHYKITNYSIDKRSIDFLLWAIQRTNYYPESETTILEMDSQNVSEAVRLFGNDWISQDLDRYYKETFLRRVKGYNYGFILTTSRDGQTRLIWRTRNYGINLHILDILNNYSYGFKGGGHINAGGGSVNLQIRECSTRIIKDITSGLKKLN